MSDVSSLSHAELDALLNTLADSGETVAVAESLTGGLVCSTLVSRPGASRVVVGGVVAYQTDVKASVLKVSESLLAERGAVDPDVALNMARSVRTQLGSTIGLATTGVAGPDPQDGVAVGTVFVALVGDRGERVENFMFDGSRDDIRHHTVGATLRLLESFLREE
jgi:nicotinamide-nucleotide amidase